jgi:hypothetical protein
MYLDNVIEQLKSDIYDAEFEYKHAMENQDFTKADYCEERANDLRAKLVEVMKNKQQIQAFEFITQNMIVIVDNNNKRDFNCACLFLKNGNTPYLIDSAYDITNPEKYKKLLELKEVL